MTDINVTAVKADLVRDEGFRSHIYDDATGKGIVPGVTVVGHPTVGSGFALDVDGITPDENDYLLTNRVLRADAAAGAAFSWYAGVPELRRRVVLEMIYNLGIAGFSKFHSMIAAVQVGDWAAAGAEMLNSAWATQVGDRAKRLSDQMITGVAS